jgi:ribosomal protein S8
VKSLKFFAIAPIALLAAALLTGCAHHTAEPPLTQLQIREVQSREFHTSDTKLVMKSMMNVLQDEGFIVKNAVADLGLLSAEKTIDIENKTSAFLLCLLNHQARWSKQDVLEASANVSEYGYKTRVRMNFQIKRMDNYGCPQDVQTILDPEYYQDFFDKVHKGIFIQEQEI